MKTITVMVTIALMFAACKAKGAENTICISGRYNGDLSNRQLHLSKAEHGNTTHVSTAIINEDGSFQFDYVVQEAGLFVLNIVDKANKRAVKGDYNDLKRFFLEPGKSVKLELQDDTYTIVNANKKNQLLTEWNTAIDTSYVYLINTQLDYETYFPFLPGMLKITEDFKSHITTDDKRFNELLNLLVDAEMKYTSLQFLYSMRSKHPTKEMYPAYYNRLLKDKSAWSERLLEMPFGMKLGRVGSLFAFLNSEAGYPKPDNRIDELYKLIQNKLLCGYVALTTAKKYTGFDDEFIAFKKQISPYLLNEYLVNKFEQMEAPLKKFAKGKEATDFNGFDKNGKEHKLSDYKGKLVYVDVWATWCGPCKAEIPALKILEEKYHGKDIVFMSVSVDKEKDRQKWIDFVEEKQLKGVQVMVKDAFKSTVSQAYEIKGIPRFMLFDKDGKIVTTDAPRPSNEKIERLLNHYL